MSQYFFDTALNVCIYAYIVKAINHYGKKPFFTLFCNGSQCINEGVGDLLVRLNSLVQWSSV